MSGQCRLRFAQFSSCDSACRLAGTCNPQTIGLRSGTMWSTCQPQRRTPAYIARIAFLSTHAGVALSFLALRAALFRVSLAVRLSARVLSHSIFCSANHFQYLAVLASRASFFIRLVSARIISRAAAFLFSLAALTSLRLARPLSVFR